MPPAPMIATRLLTGLPSRITSRYSTFGRSGLWIRNAADTSREKRRRSARPSTVARVSAPQLDAVGNRWPNAQRLWFPFAWTRLGLTTADLAGSIEQRDRVAALGQRPAHAVSDHADDGTPARRDGAMTNLGSGRRGPADTTRSFLNMVEAGPACDAVLGCARCGLPGC
jgi:hypothetical protein